MTPFHAKFWAYELTRRAPADSVDRLATALVDAQVDLNPHQVDAALFAFRSPLSKGVLLADEVGLGKTIEAGLVIAQKWAERRRRLLVVTPSNLRKQWHQELSEKFFLPCAIIESKPYNDDIKKGRFRPYERDAIVICSYQFARNKAADVNAMPWDDRITGSKTADMRSALVEYFRDQGAIMIATEAGAEGINLQFCSMVVNYDLPWNPQRIEQRIGRCHRYGQKHDVVVLNFLNSNNAADQRVFQLLSEKFRLFEGVFGASDEVLGAIESGVDIEKRIAAIYQECRKTDDIQKAFDALQLDLNLEIEETLSTARQQLLENFDDEVREKLRVRNEVSKAALGRYEQLLMQLTQFELRDHARFVDESSFELRTSPYAGNIPTGVYKLPRRSGEAHFYRLSHPLAEAVVSAAKSRNVDGNAVDVAFDLTAYKGKISAVEPLRGRSGWLQVTSVAIESLDQAKDHLLVAATMDDGGAVEEEAARRLFSLPASVGVELPLGDDRTSLARAELQRQGRLRALENSEVARHLLQHALLNGGIRFPVLPFGQCREHLAVVTNAVVMVSLGARVTWCALVEHREHVL